MFGCINTVIVLIIALMRGTISKLTPFDWICFLLGCISIGLWIFLGNNKEQSSYGLYVGILADACAAIPTFVFLLKNPDQDLPFAWSVFALAYGLDVFAIKDHTFSNYALPIYMFLMAGAIAASLIIFRIKKRIPIQLWI